MSLKKFINKSVKINFCGAKDQKQRMINKIYGWLKTRKLLTEDSLKDLRKAMEE